MSIELILGCMFSGKTSELISKYDRYTIGNKKCIMIKYKNDNRYSQNEVVTHNNIKVNAVNCECLEEFDQKVNMFDVICIDEVQFYNDADIYCDKWANLGKIVIASGLNGTSERQPFEIISKLIPKCENIIFKTAICRDNGNDACFTKCNVAKTDKVKIGGSDIYEAVDRLTYNKN